VASFTFYFIRLLRLACGFSVTQVASPRSISSGFSALLAASPLRRWLLHVLFHPASPPSLRLFRYAGGFSTFYFIQLLRLACGFSVMRVASPRSISSGFSALLAAFPSCRWLLHVLFPLASPPCLRLVCYAWLLHILFLLAFPPCLRLVCYAWLLHILFLLAFPPCLRLVCYATFMVTLCISIRPAGTPLYSLRLPPLFL